MTESATGHFAKGSCDSGITQFYPQILSTREKVLRENDGAEADKE
jgi:hypothetical protein